MVCGVSPHCVPTMVGNDYDVPRGLAPSIVCSYRFLQILTDSYRFLQILTDSYQKTSLPGFYSFTTRITVFKKTCSSPWKVETSVQNCQDMAHLKAVLPLPGEDRLMGLNNEQQIIYLNNTRSYENHDLNQS